MQVFTLNKPIPEIIPKQRVVNNPTNKGEKDSEKRVTTPLANNLTPRVLQTTLRTHQRCTRRNTPGALPKIVRAIKNLLEGSQAHIIPPLDDPAIAIKPTQQCVQEKVTQLLTPTTP